MITASSNQTLKQSREFTSYSFGIKQLCFLGIAAKGNLDLKFLKELSEKGIPEGNYSLGSPLPQEQWPSAKFK